MLTTSVQSSLSRHRDKYHWYGLVKDDLFFTLQSLSPQTNRRKLLIIYNYTANIQTSFIFFCQQFRSLQQKDSPSQFRRSDTLRSLRIPLVRRKKWKILFFNLKILSSKPTLSGRDTYVNAFSKTLNLFTPRVNRYLSGISFTSYFRRLRSQQNHI